MASGGRRAGAGRRKGSKNRRSKAKEILAKCEATGRRVPLDMLLDIMNAPEPTLQPGEDPKLFLARAIKWREERLEAAKAAAPYCHPKLAQVEHRGQGEGGAILHRHVIEFV